MVHAINQNHNSSMRGHIRKSSSKDDILHREQVNKSDQSLQDALNSSNTVILYFYLLFFFFIYFPVI